MKPESGGTTYEVEKYTNGTGTPTVIYTGLTHEVSDFPWGLAVTSTGNVYISTDFTTGGGSIIELTYDSGSGTYTGSTFQTGKYFTALAVDAGDNLYDTEYDAANTTYAVVKYAANSAANSAGTTLYDNLKTGAGYAYPTGLAVAANGDVYVADAFSNTPAITDGGHIYKLTAASSYAATTVSTGMYSSSLTLDASGDLYSSENSGSGYQLVKYPSGGGAPSIVFTPLHTNGIYYPWGIAVYNSFDIFVTDGDDGTHGGEVIHLVSANASLTTLRLTPNVTLVNTGTVGNVTSYTASVSNATASVTVTATTVDPSATITVDGTAVISGSPSGSIPLAEGTTTTINTVVTAENGTTTRTYAINVTRAPSANASLNTIALTPGSTLTNTGTVGGTTTFTTSVNNATSSVTVTPTVGDANAKVTVNSVAVASGTASGSIALAEGAVTTITTVVTAQDGTTTRTYLIKVTRAPSNNAGLSVIALTPYSTLTNTGTVGSTTTYTTTASSATTSVKVTPTTADANATVKVNGVTVASGTASASIALPVGQTTINTVVTAQDGTTTRTYSITVTRFSNNASLSTIKLTPTSTLTNAGTVGSTTTYTTSVTNATASVKVTPTTQDANATVKVNGTAVTSGTASGSIALADGAVTTITTVATAQDGTTTRTYLIKVTRGPSSNAGLTSIALTPYSTLTNTGTVGSTTTYTTSVSNATASVKVTPTTQDANATVKVNGVTVASGAASGSIALAVGQNTINTVVTAQDGTTTRTYSITVTRVSNNASLSTIALTPYSSLTNTGTIGSTTTYTTSVSNATTSVKVTATAQDANATIKVNGTTVASGTASGSIALVVGSNTINTVVTAQDGTTTHTYSITVTRATGPLMSLYQPVQSVSVTKPAGNVTIENDGVMVHQGVSPNGDGLNDFLLIDGLIAYPENKVTIIDRSGAVIFEAKGYDNATNVFDGHSSINGKMQQPGTYFYSLDYVADGQNKHKTGYIILKY